MEYFYIVKSLSFDPATSHRPPTGLWKPAIGLADLRQPAIGPAGGPEIGHRSTAGSTTDPPASIDTVASHRWSRPVSGDWPSVRGGPAGLR